MGYRRRLNLDYTYGEDNVREDAAPPSTNKGVNVTVSTDTNATTSTDTNATTSTDTNADSNTTANATPQRYLSYSDFLNRNDYDTGGYRRDDTDDFAQLDSRGWCLLIGYILVRVCSPLLLVAHALVLGLVLWRVHHFDLTNLQREMPPACGALAVHVFWVHLVAKLLFRENYYKRRK